MPSASTLAHRGLPFANPMSEAAVDRMEEVYAAVLGRSQSQS